jgi:AcrR family transcriptional regulator
MNKRTQRERTEISRRKVIDATVRCIQAGGVTNATVSKISAEAGLTSGVIQHQFGNKEGLFAAILESASDDLFDKLDNINPESRSIFEAVDEFAEILWSHYSQPIFRATMEILLNNGKELEKLEGRVLNIGLRVVSVWRKIIKSTGCQASNENIGIAGEILETSLSSFAIRSHQFHQRRFHVKKRRQKLVESVVYLLSCSE